MQPGACILSVSQAANGQGSWYSASQLSSALCPRGMEPMGRRNKVGSLSRFPVRFSSRRIPTPQPRGPGRHHRSRTPKALRHRARMFVYRRINRRKQGQSLAACPDLTLSGNRAYPCPRRRNPKRNPTPDQGHLVSEKDMSMETWQRRKFRFDRPTQPANQAGALAAPRSPIPRQGRLRPSLKSKSGWRPQLARSH